MSKAKQKVEVELTGNISEVLYAEFKSMRQELTKLKQENKITHEYLAQVIANQNHPPKLFNDKDIMFMLGICIKTLQNYRAAGKIRYLKMEKKIYYTQQHIDEFLDRFDSKHLNKMVV
ncbi:MAG: helix-turn-helix domain-containing protein [Paludibacter sp.]